MDGHVLPENVVVPDSQASGTAIVLEVLRSIPNDGTGVETVPGADARVAGEMDERPDVTGFTEFHVGIDDGVWTDAATGRNPSVRMHHGRGMDDDG